MSSEQPVVRGWGWPLNSRKAHYFLGGRSWCGKWLFFGPVETGKDKSPDNCAACMKKLEKHNAGPLSTRYDSY